MSAPPETVTLTCHDVGGGGWGVAHHEGRTWMLRGALPGETVAAGAVFERGGVIHGRVLEVLEGTHPARLADHCPHAASCGGCDWSHVDPRKGTELKARAAAGAARFRPSLARALATAPVKPSDLAYRLRTRLHWDPATRRLGFFRPHSWEVVPIPGCGIVSPTLAAHLPRLEASLARTCPERVDVEWLEDLAGSTVVAALRPTRGGPSAVEPVWVPPPEELGDDLHGFHVLDRRGAVEPVWGPTSVVMELPVPLTVPVGAFFQVNRHLVPWLFHRVAALAGGEPLPALDLHAGVGYLGAAVLAAGCPQLTLVEPFRPAARAAAGNLPRARVAVGRTAEAWLARHPRLPSGALAILDPPRSGLSPELRRRLAGWHPRRILMLACDPGTWARDTAFLLDRGYSLAHLELVDLFPWTHHVEVLAVLEAA